MARETGVLWGAGFDLPALRQRVCGWLPAPEMRQDLRLAPSDTGAVCERSGHVGDGLGAGRIQGVTQHALRGDGRGEGAAAAVAFQRQSRVLVRDGVAAVAKKIRNVAWALPSCACGMCAPLSSTACAPMACSAVRARSASSALTMAWPSSHSASGILGVITLARGISRRSASSASGSSRRAPEVATITGSSTTMDG